MKPYDCHNREIQHGYWAPARFFKSDGSFEHTSKYTLHRNSTNCIYTETTPDERCHGCKHEAKRRETDKES